MPGLRSIGRILGAPAAEVHPVGVEVVVQGLYRPVPLHEAFAVAQLCGGEGRGSEPPGAGAGGERAGSCGTCEDVGQEAGDEALLLLLGRGLGPIPPGRAGGGAVGASRDLRCRPAQAGGHRRAEDEAEEHLRLHGCGGKGRERLQQQTGARDGQRRARPQRPSAPPGRSARPSSPHAAAPGLRAAPCAPSALLKAPALRSAPGRLRPLRCSGRRNTRDGCTDMHAAMQRTHKRMHTYLPTGAHVHAYTSVRAHIRTHTDTHPYTRAHMCTCTHIPSHTHQLCSELPHSTALCPTPGRGGRGPWATQRLQQLQGPFTNHAVVLDTNLYMDHGYTCVHSVTGAEMWVHRYVMCTGVCLHTRYVCVCADRCTYISMCLHTLQQTQRHTHSISVEAECCTAQLHRVLCLPLKVHRKAEPSCTAAENERTATSGCEAELYFTQTQS